MPLEYDQMFYQGFHNHYSLDSKHFTQTSFNILFYTLVVKFEDKVRFHIYVPHRRGTAVIEHYLISDSLKDIWTVLCCCSFLLKFLIICFCQILFTLKQPAITETSKPQNLLKVRIKSNIALEMSCIILKKNGIGVPVVAQQVNNLMQCS